MIFTEQELKGLTYDPIMKHMPEKGPWHMYEGFPKQLIARSWDDTVGRGGKLAVIGGKVIAVSEMADGRTEVACVPFAYTMTAHDDRVPLSEMLKEDMDSVIRKSVQTPLHGYHIATQMQAVLSGGELDYISAIGTMQMYDCIGDGVLLASTGFTLRRAEDTCVVCSITKAKLDHDIPAFEVAKYMGDIMDAEGNLYGYGPEDRGMSIATAVLKLEARVRQMN